MADRYTKIFSKIWRDKDFRSLDDSEQVLFLYLTTTQHGNMAGYYEIPLDYICLDRRKPEDEIRASMEKLKASGMICYKDDIVLVKNFLKYNTPSSGTQLRGVGKAVKDIPITAVDVEFIRAVCLSCPGVAEHLSKERLTFVSAAYDKGDTLLNTYIANYILPLIR